MHPVGRLPLMGAIGTARIVDVDVADYAGVRRADRLVGLTLSADQGDVTFFQGSLGFDHQGNAEARGVSAEPGGSCVITVSKRCMAKSINITGDDGRERESPLGQG